MRTLGRDMEIGWNVGEVKRADVDGMKREGIVVGRNGVGRWRGAERCGEVE